VPRLTLVAAVAANGVIGRDNALPWRLPGDLKRFRALTMGHAVIMGRRTFESLGRPLPGRTNIVLSRHGGRTLVGAIVVSSLDDGLAAVPRGAEAFVIGGAEIYRLALARADRLVLTEVHGSFDGDVRFPPYERGSFVEIVRDACVDAASGLRYDIVTYDRRASGSEPADTTQGNPPRPSP
jgi:dihydrofolate reductase